MILELRYIFCITLCLNGDKTPPACPALKLAPCHGDLSVVNIGSSECVKNPGETGPKEAGETSKMTHCTRGNNNAVMFSIVAGRFGLRMVVPGSCQAARVESDYANQINMVATRGPGERICQQTDGN